ncbi:MAG: hypothetical protein JO285_05470, partial [Kutzneria sp.]|nr:hypothetical protein [Kutzneria sp.]
MADSDVFGDRIHRFAAPAWVMFEALTVDLHKWLDLVPGEVRPRPLDAERPHRVVWSSLWPVRPEDTVEFYLAPDGPGTTLRFVWRSPSPPDERGVAITRQRLNRKLGGDLRRFIDEGPPVLRDRP